MVVDVMMPMMMAVVVVVIIMVMNNAVDRHDCRLSLGRERQGESSEQGNKGEDTHVGVSLVLVGGNRGSLGSGRKYNA